MPKRSRKAIRSRRSLKKRKIYRAKRRFKRATTTVARNRFINDRTIVKLRYVESLALDAGIGTHAYHTWRVNSIYDPNFSGPGHQPMGHDFYTQAYERYTVLGAKVTFIGYQPQNDPAYGQYLSIVIDQQSTYTPQPLDNIMEQRKVPFRFICGANARNLGKVTAKFSPKKLFGIKDLSDNDDLSAPCTSNPDRVAYCHTIVSGYESAVDSPPVYCRCIIDFIVMYTGPKLQAVS